MFESEDKQIQSRLQKMKTGKQDELQVKRVVVRWVGGPPRPFGCILIFLRLTWTVCWSSAALTSDLVLIRFDFCVTSSADFHESENS